MEIFKVFVSHTSRIKKVIGKLKNIMEWYGVSCFVAHDDIQVSMKWQEKLRRKSRHAMHLFHF